MNNSRRSAFTRRLSIVALTFIGAAALTFGTACEPPAPVQTCSGPDRDGDGVCDAQDPCPDHSPNDPDGDGVCGANVGGTCDAILCDPNATCDDASGQPVCTCLDGFEGDGDTCEPVACDDADGDGLCDGDDPCPEHNPNDPDGDGVCGFTAPTPVDCEMGEWSGWSACSAACDGGTQTRTRDVLVSPADGGAACGAVSESRACNVDACPAEVNGWNASLVAYEQDGNQGHFKGAFIHLGEGDWVENYIIDGRHQEPILLHEVQRDEWSVYLESGAYNFIVQLDLYTHEIKNYDTQQVYATDITGAPDRINGLMAREVTYPGGAFSMTSADGDWVERNSDGVHTFTEEYRDEWSVYLRSTDRDVSIQLDLWDMQVRYTGPGSNERIDLYTVTEGR